MRSLLTLGARLFGASGDRLRDAGISARGILLVIVFLPAVLLAVASGRAVFVPFHAGPAATRIITPGPAFSDLLPAADCGPLGPGTTREEAVRALFPPRIPHIGQVILVRVLATAYSSATEETDDSPELTAANTSVQRGIIALSRDLLREFTPGAPFGFGDHVEIPGVGRFVVEDTMSPRWVHRADIWCPSREEAMAWGAREVRLRQERALAPRGPDVASPAG